MKNAGKVVVASSVCYKQAKQQCMPYLKMGPATIKRFGFTLSDTSINNETYKANP